MGRSYAGVLGCLAFLTSIGHGLAHAAGAEQTLWWATLSLFAFAALGAVAGSVAGWIVKDSVRSSLTAELARRDTTTRPQAAATP